MNILFTLRNIQHTIWSSIWDFAPGPHGNPADLHLHPCSQGNPVYHSRPPFVITLLSQNCLCFKKATHLQFVWKMTYSFKQQHFPSGLPLWTILTFSLFKVRICKNQFGKFGKVFQQTTWLNLMVSRLSPILAAGNQLEVHQSFCHIIPSYLLWYLMW